MNLHKGFLLPEYRLGLSICLACVFSVIFPFPKGQEENWRAG